jgi:hypothetical protein
VIDAGDGDEEETGMGSGDGGVRGVVAVGIGRGGRGGGGWEEATIPWRRISRPPKMLGLEGARMGAWGGGVR